MSDHAQGVVELTADELRAFIAEREEGRYVLIDVRQPDEYLEGHLPGAQLVPLTELETRVEELDECPDRVIYCRNGARSGHAAEVLRGSLANGRVFHLTGGLLSWQGRTVAEQPRLKVFESAETLADALRIAIDLEKGAHRLYQVLLELVSDQPAAPLVRTLMEGEADHAWMLYGFYKKACGGEAEPFDELFEQLSGEVLESGERLDDVVARLKDVADRGAADLLDVAAEMELAAHDLYRTLAGLAEDDEARETFLELAQEEKLHVVAALAAIEAQAAERVALA